MKQELRSLRTRIRPWRHLDSVAQDAWPPFQEPAQIFWHIPRRSSLLEADLAWGYDYDPTRYVWAVENPSGTLIGRISLRDVDKQKGVARLGVSFGAPYVGQGLGTETLTTFLHHYFGPLGFQRIVLDVAGTNRRAVQCYDHLGFHYTGNDWRAVNERDDLSFLDDPAYSDILPYIRRGRHGTWVQFFDMELSASAWQERSRTAGA